MSDKSKLGFNINPKSYDELNSTDNLITSGSDSGWLGKKLQGDDSNDLDLSKINPLFDKELYEKYRPGVNTNDGSVNQDIWGYKCFNSPVSFRNGIYGDTYSITENKSSDELINLIPETYATIKSDTTVKNKIYNRTDNDTNNYYEYAYNDYSGVVDYDYSKFTYFENVFHDHNEHTITDSSIDSHIESRSHGLFATNDLSERTLCSVIPKVYNGVTYEGADAQYVYSVNYASSQYERKLQAYTPKADYKIPLPSGDEHITEEIKEENTTAILSMSAVSPYILEHDDDVKLGSNIRLETISEQYGGDDTSNQRSAAIEISSPKHDCYIYGPSVNISAKMDNSTGNLNITPGVIFITANVNASAYICIDGEDDSITLYAGKLNLPSTIVTHAKALSKEINSANYIYATDNSILPSNDSVISLGDLKTKYNTIYTNKLIATDESTIANLIIKNNLTYSDFSNHVVKYKLKNTSQPGINHAVTQSYKSNYANNELSILYTESFNIGTDHCCNIYKEYGLPYGICIYGDDDSNGVSDIVIGSQNISILKPVRPLYAVHTEIVTSNVILKRNHSSFKIGTINAIGKSIIITPTCGDVYDIYVFTTNAHGFSYTCTNLTGLSQDKNGLILPGTILLPRLRDTAEDPYYYTRVVVENTVNSDITLQKDEVVFSGFNASQPIAEYGTYGVVLEHIDYLAYEVLETVFIKSDEVYFKCKVKVVDRHAAEKFSAIV